MVFLAGLRHDEGFFLDRMEYAVSGGGEGEGGLNQTMAVTELEERNR